MLRRCLSPRGLPFALVLGASPAARAAPAGEPVEAPASTADALVAEGARLGGEGRLEEAILRFKAAEAAMPRALHDCNIGLAYARLGRLPQGHFFLTRCQRRTTDPLPDWVTPRIETTLAQLRAGPYAPVRIETAPAPAPVTISVFAPDETVDPPADVWLPQGVEVLLTIGPPGPDRGEARVRLVSPAPTRVLVERPTRPMTGPVTTPPEPVAVAAAPRVAPAERADWPWWLAAGGGLAIAGGGLVLGSAAGLAADARAADSAGRYDDLRDRAELRWGAGWALTGVGAVALGLGLALALGAGAPDDSGAGATP
jgi:hypothetical protein